MRTYEDHEMFVAAIKARGWEAIAAALIDALAPLGAIGAQLVYVAQPAARAFGVPNDLLTGLAGALENPDALARIRAGLDDDTPDQP
jgi:hypothetical protein